MLPSLISSRSGKQKPSREERDDFVARRTLVAGRRRVSDGQRTDLTRTVSEARRAGSTERDLSKGYGHQSLRCPDRDKNIDVWSTVKGKKEGSGL